MSSKSTRPPYQSSRHPRKATRNDGHSWNLLATLETISERGSVSRADVARSTGLTKAAVSTLVSELIEAGWVRELGQAPAGAVGKPPTMLALNARGRVIVALDLSHRPVQAALLDITGRISSRFVSNDLDLVGDLLLEEVLRLIDRCVEEATDPILGIGIGTPGIVDVSGSVIEAANLGWRDLALSEQVKARTGLPVSVGNDAHLAALAEYRSHPNAAETLLLVKIGEGIGAGLVLRGTLHNGDHFVSGEIGHVVIDPDGGVCRCGNRGCLETVAAVPAIIAAVNGESGEHEWDALALAERVGADVVRAAVWRAGSHIGSVLSGPISLLDVTHVVIASDLANASDALAESIGSEISRRIHPAMAKAVTVEVASSKNLVLKGAVALVLRDQLGVVLR